jgi:hypothetical protein
MRCAMKNETNTEQTYRNYMNIQGMYCEIHFYLEVHENVKRKTARYKEWQVGILLHTFC